MVAEAVTVNAAEIARLAGVGRAAVSNWRRRHDDFPKPAGGTDASPLFSLTEVEQWLRAQGKLADIPRRDRLWPFFEALGDRDRMGLAVAAVGVALLTRRADGEPGDGPQVEGLPVIETDSADRELIDRAVETALQEGPYETFEYLRGRWLDAHVRQISTTPRELADLIAALALPTADGAGVDGDDGAGGNGIEVLDPACGTGSLLSAVLRRRAPGEAGTGRTAGADRNAVPGGPEATGGTGSTGGPGGAPVLLGQESDATLAALAAVRLVFEHRAFGRRVAPAAGGPPPCVRRSDSIHQDAFERVRADAVVCNPPFNERNWGQEELAWDDPRWRYGVPARTESELAWVLHCLARLRPGGTAVLMMPPAAASRRAGRRVRSALLQHGALRAVIALPPGAAPPHSVALHLWVLRAPRPASEAGRPAETLLFVDTAGTQTAEGKARIDWAGVHDAALRAWREFDGRGGAVEERSGVCRAVRIVDLLDDEVDLTPARHVPHSPDTCVRDLDDRWGALDAAVREAGRLSASLRESENRSWETFAEPWPTTTVGDLMRGGLLGVRSGSVAHRAAEREGVPPADGAVPVLGFSGLIEGGAPSGWVPREEVDPEWTVARAGDLVVAAGAHSASVHVVGDTPVLVGPRLEVVSPDADAIDPWFLAGCLRSSAGARQAATHASTTSRIDIRRMQVPRLPIAEQRRYGAVFRRLEELRGALGRIADHGGELQRVLTDAFASGTLRLR